MSEPASYHMTPDEFRRYGRAVVDWIADYYQEIEKFPGALRLSRGRSVPPCHPSRRRWAKRSRRFLGDLDQVILPGRHALAVAQLFCLLPGKHLRSGDPGRPDLLRAGRAGHVVGDQPRLHRAGDACNGLDGGTARPAGALQIDIQRGRRNRHSASSATLCALLIARSGRRSLLRTSADLMGGWWRTPPARRTHRLRRRSRSPASGAKTCA